MKKVFYLKGMSTDKKEYEFIYDLFLNKDIELINLVSDYSNLGKDKEKVIGDLCDKISSNTEDGEEIKIICHSMGCNFLPSIIKKLGCSVNAVLISPEFERITKAEQQSIIPSDKPITNPPNEMPFSINKIKSILLFVASKAWFNEDKDSLNGSKLTVLSSKGDKYVSKLAIENLCDTYGGNYHLIDSNSHNPLLERTDAIDIICDTFEQNKTLGL